ncbi:MAG: response regulator transcription factor, partial [Eubacteriales bacterium]
GVFIVVTKSDALKSDIFKRYFKTAYAGNILLNPEIAAKVVRALNASDFPAANNNKSPFRLHLLTPRELDVANLIAESKSNREICEKLFLSEGTVKNYVTRILEKLELSSRTELAVYMIRSGGQ